GGRQRAPLAALVRGLRRGHRPIGVGDRAPGCGREHLLAGGVDDLVELVGIDGLAADAHRVVGDCGGGHGRAQATGAASFSAHISLYIGNSGFVSGTILRIVVTGPLALTWPLARPTVTLYSPRQYLLAR